MFLISLIEKEQLMSVIFKKERKDSLLSNTTFENLQRLNELSLYGL